MQETGYNTIKIKNMQLQGGHPPPHPFLRFDVPTFYRFIGKTKVLNNACNQFASNFYPQSIIVLEEYLQKW